MRRRPDPGIVGEVARHRLNPGGDRQANHALWRIVFTRLGSDPATRAYAERRTAEGKSKAEIIRCLKRYVAREVYRYLRPAAANARSSRGRPGPLFGCRVTCWPAIDLPAVPGHRQPCWA